MIVTEEGKNIYPEDIEAAFESLAVKEFCVFAANYIWPKRSMADEKTCAPYSISSRDNSTAKNSGETSTRGTIAC